MLPITRIEFPEEAGWLVVLGLTGPLRQYCILYRPSPKESEKEVRNDR